MPTKSEIRVVRHYIERAVFDRALGRIQYGADVAEHFMATVPESDRRSTKATGRGRLKLDFHVPHPGEDVDTIAKQREMNGRKVLAYIDGEAQPPWIMRDSFFAALPEPYQTECRNACDRARGFRSLPVMGCVVQDAGALHVEYADVARTGGALRANDGAINKNDPESALLQHKKELLDLKDSIDSELALVEEAMDKQSGGNR